MDTLKVPSLSGIGYTDLKNVKLGHELELGDFQFEAYVNTQKLPLSMVCSKKIHRYDVFSEDVDTEQFFKSMCQKTRFANSVWCIGHLGVLCRHRTGSEKLLVYILVKNYKASVRCVHWEPNTEQRVSRHQQQAPPVERRTDAIDRFLQKKKEGEKPKMASVEATDKQFRRILERVILSAFRLRGIHKNEGEWKELYYNVHRSTRFAMRHFIQSGRIPPMVEVQKCVEGLLSLMT